MMEKLFSGNPVSIVVLAGGKSRRMGKDKARLKIDETSFLEKIVEKALKTGCGTMVIGRERPPKWRFEDIPFHRDLEPGRGPLLGLMTAFHQSLEDILLIACDMPLMSLAAMEWLLMRGKLCRRTHGVVVMCGERIEPLFSYYKRDCLPLIKELVREDCLSMMALLTRGDFQRVWLPEEHLPALSNINTPGNYERIKE